MKKGLKYIGVAFGVIAGLAVIIATAMVIIGTYRLKKTYDLTTESITIPMDEATLARGEYLFAVNCAGCHGEDAGGTPFFSDPALGNITAPNLTPGVGGIGASYTNEDYVQAIRYGVRPNGEPIAVMPSKASWYFSDEDLGAIIAYTKSVPPVNNDVGRTNIKPLGRFLIAVGVFDVLSAENIDHTGKRPEPVEQGITEEYGEYIINTGNCRFCHGEKLSGTQPPEPGSPFGTNLTPGGELAEWTAQDFIKAMRTGISPHGHRIDPEYMPWEDIGRLSDDDLSAMFLYLQSLPALETTD